MKMKCNYFNYFCLLLLIFGFSAYCHGKEQHHHQPQSPTQPLIQNQSHYQLVACAIFQNETFFLKEWVEYHRSIGVEHFYLYNNLSSDNYQDILQPYIKEGLVELFEWPIEQLHQHDYLKLLQIPAYNDALERIKGKAKWAAFIDLDEFLVPLRHDNLLDMLEEYEDCAGLAINWQVFGTSNITDLPSNELITENFVYKAARNHPMNQTVKLIVQPECVERIENPHAFQFYPDCYAVNSNKIPLKDHQMGQEVVLDTVCINHYWFGSRNWFFNHKIPRREKWGIKFPKEYSENIIDSFNCVKDESIQKFVPHLKANLAKQYSVEIKKPFVTCDLMGQLGNQFFQIATATALALDHDATPLFPALTTEQQYNVPLNYEKIFNHLNTECSEHPIEYIHIEPQFPYSAIEFHPNMSIRGWFQSEKYFAHHKHEIVSLFAPRPEIKRYLYSKYENLINMDNTVAIHYRSYEAEDPEHKVYEECGINYFERAIEAYPKDSLFVVFSNDMNWCKSKFSAIDRNFVYIEGEAHYHDLYLMSMCKHNIICNSSFSWWAAYLNINPKKRVIAPIKWFNPSYEAQIKGSYDLIPSDWILM